MFDKLNLIKKYAQQNEDVPVPVRKSPKNKKVTELAPDSNIPVARKMGPVIKERLNNIVPGFSPKQVSDVITAVKEMQVAMQNLSQTVIADADSGTMAYKPQDAAQPGATNEVKTSKKSFNDFIAEQYLGSLDEDKKGVEWNTDKQVVTLPGKQKTQTDIYELDVVMDTLRRVGASTKEFSVDGKWDFRTDNALRNIMGFAYALLQLEGDFGLDNNVYNFDHWKNFNKALSGYKIENGIVNLSPANKMTRANALTKHLKAINKLYNHFRQQVLARPEFRPTIEGKRPFDRYHAQGSNKDALTNSEEQMSKSDAVKITLNTSYSAPNLANKKLDYIPLKALRNKDEYIKWMVNYAGNTEATAMDIFNKIVKPKIELM